MLSGVLQPGGEVFKGLISGAKQIQTTKGQQYRSLTIVSIDTLKALVLGMGWGGVEWRIICLGPQLELRQGL